MAKAQSKVVKDPLAERLACLSEELGEAVQAVGKIVRHGLDSNWNGGPKNRQALARELGQVTAIAMLMVDAGDLSMDAIESGEVNKYTRVDPFLHAPSNKRLARARAKRYAEARK